MPKTETFNVRQLINASEDEIWSLDSEEAPPIELVFDDGPMTVEIPQTILSWYAWRLFEGYEKTSILKRHHMTGLESGASPVRVGKNTLPKLMENVIESIWETYGPKTNLDQISKRGLEASNLAYNAFASRLGEYVTSIDILDFIEVVRHPEIAKILADIKPTRNSVEIAYERATAVLKDPNTLIGNPVAEGVKSGGVRVNQVMQCAIMRGWMTEIDGNFFPKLVASSYTTGLCSAYEALVESRSATKSQINTTGPVKDAETLNRIEQLVTGMFVGVETIDGKPIDDCGSTRYREAKITSKTFQDWVGKYYLDEKLGQLRVIKRYDRHLIGQRVKFRSVFDCEVKSSQHCCRTCYGDLYYNIPSTANLGHHAAVTTCKDVSQIIISTKHHDASAVAELMKYTDFELQYVTLGNNPQHIMLNRRVKELKNLHLKIPVEAATRLSEIMDNEVDKLSIRRISNVGEFYVTFEGTVGEEKVVEIPSAIGSQKASLSHAFLEYIKKRKFTLSAEGDYLINLSEWDYANPILVLPLKQMSMMDFFKLVSQVLKSSSSDDSSKKRNAERGRDKDIRLLTSFKGDPWSAVLHLHEVVQQKFQINIVHLEILVQAVRSRNHRRSGAETLDWSIPTGSEDGHLVTVNNVFNYRSLAAKLSYQSISSVFDDPAMALVENRLSSPQDAALMGDRYRF